jgi:hypothetical protein
MAYFRSRCGALALTSAKLEQTSKISPRSAASSSIDRDPTSACTAAMSFFCMSGVRTGAPKNLPPSCHRPSELLEEGTLFRWSIFGTIRPQLGSRVQSRPGWISILDANMDRLFEPNTTALIFE